MALTVYERAVEKFGEAHQHYVFIEEMGECIAAISQFKNRGRGNEQDMIEEIADVQIMLEQMKVIHGKKLEMAVIKKLQKLHGHL